MSASRASSVRRVRSENDVSSADASPVSFLPAGTAIALHITPPTPPASPPAPRRASNEDISALSIPQQALTRPERVHDSPPSSPPAVAQGNAGPAARPPRPSIATFRHDRSLYTRAREFFGYGRDGSRERRALVGLYWRLIWGLIQITVVIILLAIAGHTKSPSPYKDSNEWVACDRPLGAWAVVWAARVVFACGMHYWGWTRDKAQHLRADQESRPDMSLATFQPPLAHEPRSARFRAPPQASASQSSASAEAPPLPNTRLYARMNTLVSLLTLSWFLTAHILEYTSVDTCRHDAPHIWWLIFGILCIMYLMVLEVLALGMVVFIIAPVLFLFWNIFLICLGRHPMQAGAPLRPAIGKLPKDAVDCIPLVMYIPPPPEEKAQKEESKAEDDAQGKNAQLKEETEGQASSQAPEVQYEYPPKPKEPKQPKRHKWFKFLRRKRNSEGKDGEDGDMDEKVGDGEKGESGSGASKPLKWEDHWDLEGFPSVVLEGNRAACAICLMDFEEPKWVGGVPQVSAEAPPAATTSSAPTAADGPAEAEDALERLRLEDAGEGAQPLRLLACGHVFHQTCLDPWLIDVSGRCPVCQRPVEIPEPPPKKERRRGRR
uniref:Expressed protein n=1 Tax=Schizophyllum commune (strain H4-8 / FGSC 9210) TaxID=578458 RepID=D8QBT5_SCHCM